MKGTWTTAQWTSGKLESGSLPGALSVEFGADKAGLRAKRLHCTCRSALEVLFLEGEGG